MRRDPYFATECLELFLDPSEARTDDDRLKGKAGGRLIVEALLNLGRLNRGEGH